MYSVNPSDPPSTAAPDVRGEAERLERDHREREMADHAGAAEQVDVDGSDDRHRVDVLAAGADQLPDRRHRVVRVPAPAQRDRLAVANQPAEIFERYNLVSHLAVVLRLAVVEATLDVTREKLL